MSVTKRATVECRELPCPANMSARNRAYAKWVFHIHGDSKVLKTMTFERDRMKFRTVWNKVRASARKVQGATSIMHNGEHYNL